MYEIGPYLRSALKKKNMKQKELAIEMNMSQEHISKICLNKVRPSFDALVHICTILDMSFSEFFAREREEDVSNVHELKMMDNYRELDVYEQEAVRELIEKLYRGKQGMEARRD